MCEMAVHGSCLFLILPLTCVGRTKTWACGTYLDSLSCCISNLISHFIESKTAVHFNVSNRHLCGATCLIHKHTPTLNKLHNGASAALPPQHCDGEVTVRQEVQLWRPAAGTHDSRQCCNDCRRLSCSDGLDTGSELRWVLRPPEIQSKHRVPVKSFARRRLPTLPMCASMAKHALAWRSRL